MKSEGCVKETYYQGCSWFVIEECIPISRDLIEVADANPILVVAYNAPGFTGI
jgi:hypothetical protein